MVELNQVQVSVVRSSSAQRPIVDSVALPLRSSFDGDSQHRRTSSFPENMSTGACVRPAAKELQTCFLSHRTRNPQNVRFESSTGLI